MKLFANNRENIYLCHMDGQKMYVAPYNFRARNIMWPSKYRYHIRYTMRWRTRLLMEHEANPSTFITLTYRPGVEPEDRLSIHPPQKPTPEDLRQVLKTDLKNFFQLIRDAADRGYYYLRKDGKKVRENGQFVKCLFPKLDLTKLKYYAVTERGAEEFTSRLHFHILVFGWPNNPATTQALWSLWSFGRIDVQNTTDSRINYVTKYIHKRVHAPEFISLKSNGLGLSWLTDARKQSFIDRKSFVFHMNGKSYILSSYLKKKVFTDEELLRELNEQLINDIIEKKDAEAREKMRESTLCKFFISYNLQQIQYDPELDQFYFTHVNSLSECDVGTYFHYHEFDIDERVRYPRLLTKRI